MRALELCLLLSFSIFMIIALVARTIISAYDLTLRINKLTFLPFYAAIIQLSVGMAYIIYVLTEGAIDNDFEIENGAPWRISTLLQGLGVEVLTLFMSLQFSLLSKLITYQKAKGPSLVVVKRDEHFKRERRTIY